MTREEYEKLLDKALAYIANCSEDICQICAYYDKDDQFGEEIDYYLDNGIEPCKYRRENGECACKKGIALKLLEQIKAEQ